jgi:hypothetical protein
MISRFPEGPLPAFATFQKQLRLTAARFRIGGVRLLCLLALLVHIHFQAPAGQAQSAWTRPKNTGYARFSFSRLHSQSFYTPPGNRIRSARFEGIAGSVYAEYGLTGDLTAQFDFPFLRRQSLETTGTLTATGDALVGLKYRFRKGRTPFAVSVDFGLPTGDSRGFVPLKETPEIPFRIPTGDGEFNNRVSLYTSRAFQDGRTYVSGGGGYNFRTEGFTDEISYFLQAGHKVFSAFWLSGSVQRLQPAREPNLERSVGFGVGEGVQYTTVGGEVMVPISRRYSVSAAYYQPFSARNILAGGSLMLGFGIEF